MLSARKKKRAKTYEEFYEFNEKLLLNLKYGKLKVKDIYMNYPSVIRAFEGGEVLGGEDEEFIVSYVANIGTTDAQSQIDYLNERKVQLCKLRDESGESYRKSSSVCIKICLLAGVLVAVLLA